MFYGSLLYCDPLGEINFYLHFFFLISNFDSRLRFYICGQLPTIYIYIWQPMSHVLENCSREPAQSQTTKFNNETCFASCTLLSFVFLLSGLRKGKEITPWLCPFRHIAASVDNADVEGSFHHVVCVASLPGAERGGSRRVLPAVSSIRFLPSNSQLGASTRKLLV